MNIFASHLDPRISAINLDDKRVIKMILESAQMLCTALNEHDALDKVLIGYNAKNKPKYDYFFKDTQVKAYKPTHKNHPSNVWCRLNRSNYAWLLMHMRALSDEYTYRCNKNHASMYMYQNLVHSAKFLPEGNFTDVTNCAARDDLNINYKHVENVYDAYRQYLKERWANDKLTPKWTNRACPF